MSKRTTTTESAPATAPATAVDAMPKVTSVTLATAEAVKARLEAKKSVVSDLSDRIKTARFEVRTVSALRHAVHASRSKQLSTFDKAVKWSVDSFGVSAFMGDDAIDLDAVLGYIEDEAVAMAMAEADLSSLRGLINVIKARYAGVKVVEVVEKIGVKVTGEDILRTKRSLALIRNR